MAQGTNTHSVHPLTVEKAVGMAEEYESQRESFLNRAKLKFMGSAACGGLAVAIAVALAIERGKAEGPAGAWVAGESLLASSGVALFGFGLSDKSEADDASRKSASLQGALTLEERHTGELIGRGTHHYEDQIAAGVVAASVKWDDHADSLRHARPS